MSLISGHSQSQSAYEPTLWSKLFHSVPHVNITFHPVHSQFNPENDLYLESLGILASIPAAWLITTLVILLIYLCTRCCDTKNNKKRKSRPIRCCLSLFSLLTCFTLALGFIGNHYLHIGMDDFRKATHNIHDIVKRSQEMTGKYNYVYQNVIEKNLNKLYDGPFQREIGGDAHFQIMDNSDVIFSNITSGLKAMDQLRFAIDEPNKRLSFQYVPFLAEAVEKYRWPTTMAIQALFALFCLLLFIGAIVHTRCVLILFSVCGLFSIIVLWLLASIYTGMAVALADFCYNPTPWVQHVLSDRLDTDVTAYYLKCSSGKASPFESYLSMSQRSIQDIDYRVRQIASIARKHYSPQLVAPALDDLEQASERTVQLLNDLTMSLRCEPIFRSYNTALVALCDSGLLGLILMLISAALSGFLFTILVWCNSHTWIYFKYKGRYIKVDDEDPYMPVSTIERTRAMPSGLGLGGNPYGVTHPSQMNQRRTLHTPPQTPPYHGTLNNGHHGVHTLGPGQLTRMSSQNAQAQMFSTAPRHPHHHHHSQLGPSVSGISAGGAKANAHMGTLGRNTQVTNSHGGYHGMDNLPATMTLGRRGHYASLRSRLPPGGAGGAGEDAPLGPNMGQYATLSKQCKTLESSDFY